MENMDYLVLLRGINVGGNNIIKMDFLKKAFEEMGFTDVKTFIQSGNILFRYKKSEKAKLCKKIEEALLDKVKIKINVLLITFSELKHIIDKMPKNFGEETEKYKYDVIFLIEPLTENDFKNELCKREGVDEIYEGKRVFYIKRLTEKLSGSYLTKMIKTPIWKMVTIRNLNTTKKLYEIMLERKHDMK
jgi:uncharacterized protein (DUF1697 family)